MDLLHVETSDGRKWSAKAVEDLKHERDTIMAQRDAARLELALLRGSIHKLDKAA